MLTNIACFLVLFLFWLALASYGTKLLYYLVQPSKFLGFVADIRTRLDREIPRKSISGKAFEFGKKWLYNALGGCLECFTMWQSLWFFAAFYYTATHLGCFIVEGVFSTFVLVFAWLGILHHQLKQNQHA